MRSRNKKIVLIESITPYQAEKDYNFIDHGDGRIQMRICRNQTENQGSLAEIFYEALLKESITKRENQKLLQTPQIQKMNILSMATVQSSEKRCNSGRIVRRSLSKNCSNSNSPSAPPKQIVKMEMVSTELVDSSRLKQKTNDSRISRKENCQLTSSTEKTIKSGRRSISNKKQIKYTVRSHIRS